MATRDPGVFKDDSEFVPKWFVDGDEQERLLGNMVWSNGPEDGVAAEGNKQCPGKDMVVVVGRMMVVQLFRRYDTFAGSVEDLQLEPIVMFMLFTKAAPLTEDSS
jgi:cytochrome P450